MLSLNLTSPSLLLGGDRQQPSIWGPPEDMGYWSILDHKSLFGGRKTADTGVKHSVSCLLCVCPGKQPSVPHSSVRDGGSAPLLLSATSDQKPIHLNKHCKQGLHEARGDDKVVAKSITVIHNCHRASVQNSCVSRQIPASTAKRQSLWSTRHMAIGMRTDT